MPAGCRPDSGRMPAGCRPVAGRICNGSPMDFPIVFQYIFNEICHVFYFFQGRQLEKRIFVARILNSTLSGGGGGGGGNLLIASNHYEQKKKYYRWSGPNFANIWKISFVLHLLSLFYIISFYLIFLDYSRKNILGASSKSVLGPRSPRTHSGPGSPRTPLFYIFFYHSEPRG